jgi:hypothetical protein
MKRITVFALTLGLILLGSSACGPKVGAPAGAAKPEDVLKYLPQNSQGVFFVDIHRAMATEVTEKFLNDDDTLSKYQEFVQKSGIDPKEDIFYAAIAILSGNLGENQEGAAVINMRYDKDKVLALIEEEGKEEIKTEEYNGFTMYTTEKEEGENAWSFLDASNIVVGNTESIKTCIDVMQKSKENVLKNAELADVLKRTDKNTLFWGAMLIPQEEVAKATEGNARLKPLENLKALILNFDYKNAAILVKIKAESDNPDGNKQIADLLNGLKAMGAMMIPEDKPELGDLLSSITVSFGDDFVMIEANLPEEVIESLKSEIPGMKKEEK